MLVNWPGRCRRLHASSGVCWETVMNAVEEHGTPLVDDPDRIGRVAQLGVDETAFLAANRHHHTIYVTGLVDLEGHRLIDMVEGNAAVDLRRWDCERPIRPGWPASVWWATDLAGVVSVPGCHRISITPPAWRTRFMWFGWPTAVLTPCAAGCRNDTLGHRGRKDDPLYRIRKLLEAARIGKSACEQGFRVMK